MDENGQDKIFREKRKKQKIINSSLELLLNLAEDSVNNAREEVELVGFTLKDYESEGCTILKEYRDRYDNLRKQLNTSSEYLDEKNSD